MTLFTSVLEKRGGHHPRILPRQVDNYLNSKEFRARIYKMKVGASIKIPFLLDDREGRALQERIWRLEAQETKEFRTFRSKKTGTFFVFRIA